MKNSILLTNPILLLMFCFAAAAAQDTATRRTMHGADAPAKVTVDGGRSVIPMELVGRKPVVDVKINGKGPFKFYLDTGAGATVLDQTLADELKLPVQGPTKIGDPANPGGITANRDQIDSLQVGGATFSDLIGVSWDRSGIYQDGSPRGVLGMPLFRKLLLTIDYPNNQVVIAGGALPASNGSDVLTYDDRENGLFGIPMKIGKTDVIATLDTGSSGALSFPSSYMEKLPLDGKPAEIGRARTVGGEAVIYGAKLNDTVTLGAYTYENPNITFFGRLTHLNIGYGFVSQYAITVDQQNRRIRFAKADNQPAKVIAVVETTPQKAKYAEYSGLFGERRLTAEGENLYLQRVTGPNGEGPKFKLTEISKDSFAVPGSNEVRIKVLRDRSGKISEIHVHTPSGEWEVSKKTS